MSASRPKSSQSDMRSIKKFEPPENPQQIPMKSIKKPSQLVAPKTKVPKSMEGSFVYAENERKDDTVSITSQQRPSSRCQDSKTPRGSTRASSMINSTVNQKRVLENQFNTKKLRFISLKRDIDDKQRSSDIAYEELYQLREKILASGGRDPGRIEDLFGAMNTPRGRAGDDGAEGADSDFVTQFQTTFKQMPETALAFCKELVDKRNEITNWMIELERKIDDYPSNFKEDLTHRLEQYRVDTQDYMERMSSMQKNFQHQTSELAQRVSCLCQEVKVLKQKQERLLEEGSSLLDQSGTLVPSAVDPSALEEVNKALREEKEKVLKARSKIREQRSLITVTEEKLQQALEKATKLENQLKQKESHYGQRAKELNKNTKSHEAVINKLEKQKEAIEAKVAKLTDELEFKDAEYKAMVAEYTKRLEANSIDMENEKKSKALLIAQMEDFKEKYSKLEDKCKQLLEMREDQRKEAISDATHTENELQLFNDLKETQKQLAEKEEIIQRLQIEREEIITAVNEADQENDTSTQKLTGELLKKSNELHSIKSQFVQLQKNYKRLQYKSDQMEHKLEDMKRLQAQVKDGTRASYTAQIVQLQQQVSDLRSTLTETTAQNVELDKAVMQLQVKNEHYKRYLRDLGKDLKVRKEMYQILGKGEIDDGFDANKLAHVNAEFEKLYGIIENRESQIKKLEKIIIQMEKHEEYSQAQRTRQEQRIAKLETALKEGQQAHRNRGFSFL